MKTPMQELLKEVINAREIAMGIDFRSALDFVRDAIEQDYLEKEKDVMKSCIVMGMEFIPVDPNHYNEDAEEIYNETFNTKEK